jgi:serine/threonine protein kinase/Flp pilus assembly protein TadD
MGSSALGESSFVGHKLGHYQVLQKIGAGGMGEVYLARDEHLDRDVAIKVLPAGTLREEESRRRFHGEALVLSKLDHPNIATIYDFDSQEGIDFLVTEYVPGVTLSNKLAEGPLPERDVVALGIQLAEGLVAAHSHAVVHRDLKPGNLRVTPDDRLKILDFGLAVRIVSASEVTKSTASPDWAGFAGTLLYMAPEQVLGNSCDARSDLYSAGTILYEMACGRPPFEEKLAPPLIDAILHRQPPAPRSLRPALSPRVEEVIVRCLEKNPEYRYQSARDLLADLKRISVEGGKVERWLAVLYFENLSGQKEDEYFRDGITEDITTEISKILEFRVFSRSAVLAYRDKPVTPSHVAQQLNATHIVEGSIRREADRLRITAKLVDTKTGHTLWAERYDRQLQHVFAIQDEIAKSIAAALRVVLTEKEKNAIEKVPTADVRAYDFYLRGRHFFHQFRRRGLDLAREMFAHAIAIDPHYARAYAGIAYCCAFLYMYWESSQANLEQADEASRKALELDPELAEVHASKGLSASLKKQYDLAQREFGIAIRLNPRLFEPYYFSGRNFYVQGKLEEAIRWFEQASRVLPEDYQAPMLMASALHGLSRNEDAQPVYRRGLDAAEKHLEIHPEDARAVYFGANALTQLNDKDRALKWAERALQMEPDELQVLYNVACVYALLGYSEKALDCLEKSTTTGWGQREWMERDPDLASLREHPRFKALVHPVMP